MLVVSYKQDHLEKKSFYKKYSKAFNISAWGIVLVVSTVGMSLIGMFLDRVLETQPMFMVGLCLLANGTTMWRLYQESKK